MKPAFHLHRNLQQRSDKPHSVLVFPVFKRHLVWVLHPYRGWEVPGGKIEHDESPEEAAHREAYEEAGIHIEQLLWLAEYQFEVNSTAKTKWVYRANVTQLASRPVTSEIIDVCVMDTTWTPNDVRTRQDVSPMMKDNVFPYVWPDIVPHLDVRSESGPCS